MSMNQQTVIYDVQQLKVYEFATEDVVGGASPTYGTGVICEGIAETNLTPNLIVAELKGDGGMVISKKGRTDRWTLAFTYGRLGVDSLAVMLGGTLLDSGVGPSEVVSWTQNGPNELPSFKCEFKIASTDNGVGDLHVILYNCQVKSATFLDAKTDAFGQPKIDLEAIPLLSTGQIGTIELLASQAPLD